MLVGLHCMCVYVHLSVITQNCITNNVLCPNTQLLVCKSQKFATPLTTPRERRTLMFPSGFSVSPKFKSYFITLYCIVHTVQMKLANHLCPFLCFSYPPLIVRLNFIYLFIFPQCRFFAPFFVFS